MRRASLLLAIALLVCTSPAAAFDRSFYESYRLPADGSFALTNVNGSVRIEGWDKEEVLVHAIKISRGSPSDVHRVKIDVRRETKSVAVATRYPEGEGVEVTVNYRIRVPYRATLRQVTTVNGEVLVRGMESSGDLRTINGGIELLDSAGRFDLRSTNGSVHVELSELRAAAGLNIETVNGAVHVALPPGSDADLDVSSMNGEFRSELPVVSPASREFQGRLGRGGSPVRIRTVNGAIELVNLRPVV